MKTLEEFEEWWASAKQNWQGQTYKAVIEEIERDVPPEFQGFAALRTLKDYIEHFGGRNG